MYTFEVRYAQGRTSSTTIRARNADTARQVLYRRYYAIRAIFLIAAVSQ